MSSSDVDGGLKPDNAAEVVSSGASVLVVGSAVYNDQASPAENLSALRAAAQRGLGFLA
jgi:ribulose-phosphate 3-epimerase